MPAPAAANNAPSGAATPMTMPDPSMMMMGASRP
jgi:hypothetical protein